MNRFDTQACIEHISLTDDLASEFYQHHADHDGQTFGLVQLLGRRGRRQSRNSGELVSMLLVKSCGDGKFRRLCCICSLMDTLEQLGQQHFGH
jgi:hypothetical protein